MDDKFLIKHDFICHSFYDVRLYAKIRWTTTIAGAIILCSDLIAVGIKLMNPFIKKYTRVREIDLSQIPSQEIVRGSRISAVLLITVGSGIAGISAHFLVTLFRGRYVPAFAACAMITVFCIAVLLLVMGIDSVFRREIIYIGREMVTVTTAGLFKTNMRSLRLSEFKGIAVMTYYRGEYAYHSVELVHPDETRNVILAEYIGNWLHEDELAEKIWSYSQILGLPLLDPAPKGSNEIETIEPDDSTKACFMESKPPPREIIIHNDGDRKIITFGLKKIKLAEILVLVSFVILLIYIGFFTREKPELYHLAAGFLGGILGLYLLAYILEQLLITRQIHVEKDSISSVIMSPAGVLKKRSAEYGEINKIVVVRDRHSGIFSVDCITDKGSMVFGKGLTREASHWVCGFLSSRIYGSS